MHLSRNLLGMVLCSTILMAACQQETISVPEQMKSDEILSNAGKIHNEMISYYYKNRLGGELSSEEKIAELLDLSWEYLDQNGYESGYTAEDKLILGEKISASNLKSVNTDNYSIDPSTFISQLSGTGMYSKHFQKEIKKILNLARTHDDRQIIKDYVNSTFAGIEFDDDGDITGQQLYINIFNGSYDFWEMMEKSHVKSTNLRLSSWVIINDGIGGILGLAFGPVGSIVAATAFSVGTNEEINR